MKNLVIAYESPTRRDYLFIRKYLKQNIPLWVIETFHAYHHRKGIRFFPPDLPKFVTTLIKEGRVNLVEAKKLNVKEIYQMSADKAVEVIESVFSAYRKEHEELFEFVSDSLKSTDAENVFKKNLCDRLAEFYSVNILLNRINELFSPEQVLVYPDINIHSYLYLKAILSKSKQEVYEHPNVQFPSWAYTRGYFENLKEYLLAIARLSAQTIASGFLGSFSSSRKKERKSYLYGVAVISPIRQLKNSQRRPDFIIDNNKIYPEDVIYFPLVDLTGEQKKKLAEIPGAVYYPPKIGHFFSHFAVWKKLLILVLKKNYSHNAEEIDTACKVFFNYFNWLKVLENIKLKHFISYCDFGIGHVGRNLALSRAGVQTWYFTDSMNLGCNLRAEEEKCSMRHPFWTYLTYDHFVTWNDFIAQYYRDHPGSFKQIHVVGCLWGGHINGHIDKIKNQIIMDFNLKNLQDSFKITAFDSTYSRNGFTSYKEGIVFAEHLLQLADSWLDVHILLKEKRNRSRHRLYDSFLGPKLLDLYKKMDAHPRITPYSDEEDASELISISDMVVSFPFTSTTFEALSVNRPAVWHDPLDFYRNTPYAEAGGVMTHNYEELKAKVMEIKNMQINSYRNPIPTNSPLMDPYSDGKAIDRFRELLCLPKESAQ